MKREKKCNKIIKCKLVPSSQLIAFWFHQYITANISAIGILYWNRLVINNKLAIPTRLIRSHLHKATFKRWWLSFKQRSPIDEEKRRRMKLAQRKRCNKIFGSQAKLVFSWTLLFWCCLCVVHSQMTPNASNDSFWMNRNHR